MNKRNLAGWLRKNRSSTRLAFLLQLGVRVAASLAGLLWYRLLVGAMGAALYQSYLTFQKVINLGGLGDLGMGGVVGIRAGQHLGQERLEELRRFLASARSGFLLMAAVAGGGMMLLSPWMPRLLHFKPVEGSGSLPLLFMVGGVLVAMVVLASYIKNLNYACGNVVWPVVPALILVQAGFLGQWLLARQHLPLAIQILPLVATAAAELVLVNFYIRLSHPSLAGWRPVQTDRKSLGMLLQGSFWMYLCALGSVVYRTTDALLINGGSLFPASTLTWYDSNYRACDITISLAVTASFVSMPKITQWFASPDAHNRERARTETRRLNQFQSLMGFAAALAYLAGNSLFMTIWWWHRREQSPLAQVQVAPLVLQMAFALNMAVSTAGDAGFQLAVRAGPGGLRFGGLTVAIAALANIALAWLAMRRGSLLGIALAAVAAQSVQNLLSSVYSCRRMGLPWLSWSGRAWLLPVAGVLVAGWLRMQLPLYTPEHGLFQVNILLLIVSYSALLLGAAIFLGIRPAFIKEELILLRSFIKK